MTSPTRTTPAHIHTHSKNLLTVAAVTLCLLASGQPAAGQNVPRFRVTDLTDLNDTNITADNKGTMGINNKGQVVFTRHDSVAIYTFMIHNPVVTGACGPGIICIWDVNFDCIVDGDDMDAVLDHIANCQSEPCLCEGESFAGGEGGLSAERFATALAACDPALTGEQMAEAWEHFFAALN